MRRTIIFENLDRSAPMPLYEIRLCAAGPIDGPWVVDDLNVVMGQSYQTAQMAQRGANGSDLGNIQVTVNGQTVLMLEDTRLTGFTYLPPESAADPYRIGAKITFNRLTYEWEGVVASWYRYVASDGCSIGDLRLVQSIGFQGDPNHITQPNENILSFSWEFELSGVVPELLQVRSVGLATVSGPCLFSMVLNGLALSEVNIQKWGAQIDDQPVSDIIMQSAKPNRYSLYANPQGALVHEVTFYAETIAWTEGGFDDGGTWRTSSGIYETGSPQ
jgi:hypothetical protein